MRAFLSGTKARLRDLRYGFLLVPMGIVVAFIAAAFALVATDRALGPDGLGFGLSHDPDSARTLLSAIAGAIAAITGVTFSITIVTLQLVSQQFTPRALRHFLSDRTSQVVAGVFVGVFVFALLVLRTVKTQEGDSAEFVPALSVTAAIFFAVCALVLLLIFLDHIGNSIQVSSIAAGVSRDTLSSLDRLYPSAYGEPGGRDRADAVDEWRRSGAPCCVHPKRPGYVQSIVIDDVPKQVGSPGLRIHVCVAPGDFVTEADPIAEYWPGEADGDVGRALRLAVRVANERDLEQDPGYGIRQLADIAMRAISPGINDPTTAVTCIRYLTAILGRLAERPFPDELREYADGEILVAARRVDFSEYVDAALVQVGRYADDARVAGALLKAAARATADADGAVDRQRSLLDAAERIAAHARDTAPTEADREVIDDLLAEVRAAAAVPAAV